MLVHVLVKVVMFCVCSRSNFMGILETAVYAALYKDGHSNTSLKQFSRIGDLFILLMIYGKTTVPIWLILSS